VKGILEVPIEETDPDKLLLQYLRIPCMRVNLTMPKATKPAKGERKVSTYHIPQIECLRFIGGSVVYA
jgi:hypothetical protein